RDLEIRVSSLREHVPAGEEAVGVSAQARDVAHGHRTATEAQRTELLRLVSTQREQVQQIRGEMAVAEERQRNAEARRQRAAMEATEGEAYGSRITTDREQAQNERAQFEEQLRVARETLAVRQREEDETRQGVAEMR